MLTIPTLHFHTIRPELSRDPNLSRRTSLASADSDELDSYEMVQPYGSTNHSGVDVEARDDTAGEETSLLGTASTGRKVTKREGHATMVSGIGNLVNTIVGSGE